MHSSSIPIPSHDCVDVGKRTPLGEKQIPSNALLASILPPPLTLASHFSSGPCTKRVSLSLAYAQIGSSGATPEIRRANVTMSNGIAVRPCLFGASCSVDTMTLHPLLLVILCRCVPFATICKRGNSDDGNPNAQSEPDWLYTTADKGGQKRHTERTPCAMVSYSVTGTGRVGYMRGVLSM